MADRLCIYCDDRGDCYRCSPTFEPEAIDSKCGKAWKDHKIKTQNFYSPYAVCPAKKKQ